MPVQVKTLIGNEVAHRLVEVLVGSVTSNRKLPSILLQLYLIQLIILSHIVRIHLLGKTNMIPHRRLGVLLLLLLLMIIELVTWFRRLGSLLLLVV